MTSTAQTGSHAGRGDFTMGWRIQPITRVLSAYRLFHARTRFTCHAWDEAERPRRKLSIVRRARCPIRTSDPARLRALSDLDGHCLEQKGGDERLNVRVNL